MKLRMLYEERGHNHYVLHVVVRFTTGTILRSLGLAAYILTLLNTCGYLSVLYILHCQIRDIQKGFHQNFLKLVQKLP